MTLLATEPVRFAPVLQRRHAPGLDLTTIARAGLHELHATLCPLPGETPAGMAARLDALLRDHNASVVRHEVFGSADAWAQLVGRPAASGPWSNWPVIWVEDGSRPSSGVTATHVFAVSGADVETLHLDERPVGRIFEDAHARHCLLGDLLPTDVTASRDEQARQVFEQLDAELHEAGFGMLNVSRTWLFLDDILGWYGPLNRVRREFFSRHRLFEHILPASTGIGARNPRGAAMVAGAWASKPLTGDFRIGEVLSPRQGPAVEYGSCFSRAVELVSPDLRRVLVSGTASIEPKGASVCAGDVDAQIDLTMQVVRAILVSRGMGFGDVTRATAYVRRPEHIPLWHRWCIELDLPGAPWTAIQAVVCRDELLFEIELDAHAVNSRDTGAWEI